MLCQTWTWLAATTPLVAKPTLLSANRDHSSHERTYSYCCRQRSLLLRPYLLFLLPEETAPLLVAAGRDYSSCHPHANEVGSEMSGGGSKAGGGGRAKRTSSPSRLLLGRHACFAIWGAYPAPPYPLIIFQIRHGKPTLRQPLSIRNWENPACV